jgi:hypothetical protein
MATAQGRDILDKAMSAMDDQRFSDFLKSSPDRDTFGELSKLLSHGEQDSQGRNQLGKEQRKFLRELATNMMKDNMTSLHNFKEAQKRLQAETESGADPEKDAEYERAMAPDESAMKRQEAYIKCVQEGGDPEECKKQSKKVRLAPLQKAFEAAKEIYPEAGGGRESANPDPAIVQLEAALESGDLSELDHTYESEIKPAIPAPTTGQKSAAYRIALSFIQS